MAKQPKDVKGHVLFEIFTKAIYTTFTRAIKEAVSNAYDAGADEVVITFDPPTFVKDQVAAELTIQIWDDGLGMSLDDFWEKFASIDSEKSPWQKNATTGRHPIGKFGIGSFALIPFSLSMTIYSKKYGEKPIKCVIESTKLLKKSQDSFPDHLSKNINAKIITETEWSTLYGSEDAGTLIVINGVTQETYTELLGGSKRFDDGCKGMFPDAPFTVGLKEIAWELSTLLPLLYADDPGTVHKSHKTSLSSNNKGISITMSDVELKRMIYSRPGSAVKLIDYNVDGVKAKGVILAIPKGAVQPRQANGVILRLNNVGIGRHDLFGLVGNEGIRRRITGEVHILQGLHDSLNAARDRFSGTAYDKLEAHLHKALTDLSREAYSTWEETQDTKAEEIEKSHQEKHKEAFKKKPKTKPPIEAPVQSGVEKKDEQAIKTHSEKKTGTEKKGADTKSERGSDRNVGTPITATASVFSDPVIDVRHATGTMRFDEGHQLFTKFKSKAESRTIKLVLRALHLAELPSDQYQRVIEVLLDLK